MRQPKRSRRARPLDETALKDLALSYAARFATTGAKLEGYLARKIRERGVAEDEDGRVRELDVTGLVTRLIELGYVNDDAYARAKSRDLTARGYGARRVEQALWVAGVEEQVRADHTPGEAASRRAALLLAKKRRFGPFGVSPPEDEPHEERHKRREKQVAAMLRAGHLYEHAGFIIDATTQTDIDEWLAEAEEGDDYDDHV
ncbi:MAG: regulatory protein RecX [Erythrobacter sp.]